MSWDESCIETVATGTRLREALTAVGLERTDSCFVHTKLSAFGFIPGGEQTVVDVLKDVLCEGDIMMSAQSLDLSDPQYWGYPPVDAALVDDVRNALPAFDAATTPVHGLGRTPEYFRALPGTRRSGHPLYSMSAWGAHADWLCGIADGQDAAGSGVYDMPFGENSPIARLCELDGKVIFLGTDFESCTAIHHAESLIGRPLIQETAPVARIEAGTGERAVEWITFDTVELDRYEDFSRFGEHFLAKHGDAIRRTSVGGAQILAFPIRTLVDAAQDYYRARDHELIST
ncbi:AAC(3) family N-acetyltransferase [Bifidobacterium lemurum]|uniref:Aminoglycoside N(3)-acetyltransferase n=1 Tax=Bifidobacterium lemurum TaxID=1603886 RepID=A0A261FL67_9BIFI|nr:AAC(3) family N-acetyltransferase [Bifidobacterium lemurum]OZG59930.1 AAC(3) family N-acetyltransferase [Bifidobacterium lemurum]QOL33951.1 AAC(3) family N-acetyltransferase [Bifidobacterium lemurum]